MVQTGSRTEQNWQNWFFWFRFRFQFSSAMGLLVRFSVLQKWLKNQTELNFGITTSGDGEDDADEEDNVDGWTDVRDGLSSEKREALDKSLQPVRLVLAKAI